MEGSEDLCRCFYILLWCYSTNNTPTINQQLNHSVFKGSEPYKTWILDIIRVSMNDVELKRKLY
jgi:hypothetical protein